MRVVQISEGSGLVEVTPVLLPYRDARDKGPFDVIPAAGFWLTRLPEGSDLDLTRFGYLRRRSLDRSSAREAAGPARPR